MRFIKSCLYAALLTILFCNPSTAQNVIYQSGFEPSDPALVYAAGTVNTPVLSASGGNNAPGCGTFSLAGKYNGAFITNTTLNFQAGKYYQINLYYKVATCVGTLKLYRNTLGGNFTNISAGTLISTITTNQASYAYSSSVFTVASNVSSYIGFVAAMTSAGCGSATFNIDDISIVEYDFPPCNYYCNQGGNTAGSKFISQVVFNTISRTSGFDGYACTGNTTNVKRSQTYSLSVATPVSASVYYSAAWIDWNADGDFLDAGENVMASGIHPSPVRTQSITIPATATLATTKMRVKMKYNAAITGPCEAILANDDVEDYDIVVQAAPVSMAYASTTVTQVTGNVNAGSYSNELLKVKITTTGQTTPLTASQLIMTTEGTTLASNITGARVYYTGTSGSFSTSTPVGSLVVNPPADPATVQLNFSQTLAEGDNYFWIACDVDANSAGGNVIDAKLVSATVSGSTFTLNTNPAGTRTIIESTVMSFVSASVVQNTNPVSIGSTKNDVIQVQVVTDGAINPLTVSALTFQTNGTTNTGDIQNARLYYTGNNSVFNAANQVGLTVAVLPAINTDFTISGSTVLLPGRNYFWLVYDVKATAACNPAQIDALCNSIVIQGVNRVPSPTAAPGARTINCGTAYYSQCSCDILNPSNWNTSRTGSGIALSSVAALATATNTFYVQSGHSMTTSNSTTISDLYLEPGSYITASQLLTINKLMIEANATFEQTFSQTNSVTGGSYINSFYIKKDGTWKHNNVGYLPGNSASQYFEPFSIQWFQGIGAGTFPGGTNWGSVILDIPTAPSMIINAGSLSTIHGDFTIQRWGGSGNLFYLNYDNPMNIDGSLNIKGGVMKGLIGYNTISGVCSENASAIPINVAGDLNVTGGVWNDFYCGSNTSTGMAMTVGGSVNISGGTFKMNNNLGSKLDIVSTAANGTWTQSGGTVTLGNTNIKAGKTLSVSGSKIGDVGTSSTFTVETGAKLACNTFPVTGAGNFNLQSGSWISIGNASGITSSGSSGNIQVTGTRTYNSGATYEYTGAITPQATGNFITSTTSTNYPATVANLIINKTASSAIVTLSNTTDITNNLVLTNGVMLTSAVPATAPWIRISSSATVTPDGGSAASYIDGYVRRQGASAFIFPTGNSGRWARIAITAPSISTELEARYVAAPYSNHSSMSLTPATKLSHVSALEHWYLTKPLGADAAAMKVKLFWESATQSDIFKFDSLSVARWSGTGWENTNCYGACPADWVSSTAERTYTGAASGAFSGTIQSNTSSQFGPFTLGSVGSVVLNPLPVTLLSFAAECNDGEVQIEWATASELNNDRFTLERSSNGSEFQFVTSVKGAGTTNSLKQYAFTDRESLNGISYYRLSQTDYDGTTEKLRLIPVRCGNINDNTITAFNNHLGQLVVDIVASEGSTYQVQMFDALGKKAIASTFVSEPGKHREMVDITKLDKGVYFIYLSSITGSTTRKISVD